MDLSLDVWGGPHLPLSAIFSSGPPHGRSGFGVLVPPAPVVSPVPGSLTRNLARG